MSTTTTGDKPPQWPVKSFSIQEDTDSPWDNVNIHENNCYLTLCPPHLIIDDKEETLISIDLSFLSELIELYQHQNGDIEIKITNQKVRFGIVDIQGLSSQVFHTIKIFLRTYQWQRFRQRPRPTEKKPEEVLYKEIIKTCHDQKPEDIESVVFPDIKKEIVHNFMMHPEFPRMVAEIWAEIQPKKE